MLPHVIGLMATKGRGAMAHRAAHAFFDQHYDGAKTLLVYDDSITDAFWPCEALYQRDLVRVHVEPMNLPRKRNLMAAAACALDPDAIFVIWDDDDLYSPARLRHQVRALDGAADGCVVHPFLYYDIGLDIVRRCEWRLDSWPCIRTANASLAFRRTFWERVPWDETLDPGSGSHQLAEQPLDRIVATPYADDYIVVRHGRNHAGSANLSEAGWATSEVSPADLRQRLCRPLPCD